MDRFVAAGALALAVLGIAAGAARAAPPACNNSPQITDASGDGHHLGTDVLAAWWSEASGHLQAVIQVNDGSWTHAYDDADIIGAGYAFVFMARGRTNYVRSVAVEPAHLTYDYGAFASE